MSLQAPFLIKQYLSDDLENGSYSRIFWYYPLDSLRAQNGGIGLFFEVLSGDVDDDVYEQITKRFWETFNDHFYTDGFEQALKTSIKTFIQLLRNFNVEEGIDVNIVLTNVVLSEKGYMLKLISFGDSDIFVVRSGKFADMGKLVPVNASLYDLKFLEVELDRGDALLLGNKTLLRNAFESDMLAMGSLEDLLRSLESFRENLFGSKKLFLIALGDVEQQSKTASKPQPQLVKQVTSFFGNVAKGISGAIGNLTKKKTAQLPEVSDEMTKENVRPAPEIDDLDFENADSEYNDVEILNSKESGSVMSKKYENLETQKADPVESENSKNLENLDAETNTSTRLIAPPPVVSASQPLSENLYDDIPDEGDAETNADRTVSSDDFEVAEVVTTAMVVDKSKYQGIVDDAIEAEEQEPSQTTPIHVVEDLPELKKSVAAAQPLGRISGKVGSANYVNELKSMHSPWAKISRHPAVRSFFAMVAGLWRLGIEKVMGLFGKKPGDVRQKMFLSKRPSILGPKKIAPGFWIIAVIVVLFIFFRVRATITQNNLEKKLLSELQTTQATFVKFYEENIVPIDKEDTEKQLELCAGNAQPVLTKESQVIKQIKTEKVKQTVEGIASDINAKVGECQAKYDRVNGITRVKDAELVKDFDVELGRDSEVTSMVIRSGSLVVADAGRKSVYQVNVDTMGVLKLEDPLGLVVDPTSVGVGEGTLFVCDKTNGVLYYTANASNGKDGFNRMVGTEPASIGECMKIDGFGKNAYVVPNTANAVYKVEYKGNGYIAPKKYMSDLIGIRSMSIDGKIYLSSVQGGVGNIDQYFGGKEDNFRMPDTVQLGEITASFTNPSNDKPLYVYDKTKNAVLVIEKPATNRHPGTGVLLQTYLFENNDKFKDIKSIAVNLNTNNQEVYLYVLAGSSIYKVKLK